MKPHPLENGTLVARGKNGIEVTYRYCCEEDTHLVGSTGCQTKTKWCFSIVEENDVFNFDLVDEERFMRVEMMTRNNSDRFKARGIPEAFIRLSHQIFQLPICSSIALPPQYSSLGIECVEEQHSNDARKVWQRLVASKEAYFDDARQRFTYPIQG